MYTGVKIVNRTKYEAFYEPYFNVTEGKTKAASGLIMYGFAIELCILFLNAKY